MFYCCFICGLSSVISQKAHHGHAKTAMKNVREATSASFGNCHVQDERAFRPSLRKDYQIEWCGIEESCRF